MWKRGKGGTKKKYNNSKRTGPNGEKYDSAGEQVLHFRLSLLERAGEIRDVKLHPGTLFLSRARIQFRVDFEFINATTGKKEYAEVKGEFFDKAGKRRYTDPKWPFKKRMWKAYGLGPLHVYIGLGDALSLRETLIPENQGGEDGIQSG